MTPDKNAVVEEQAIERAHRWSLSNLSFAGETKHSYFYTCHSDEHGPALLKILTEDGQLNEDGGFKVLSQYRAKDVVEIYAFDSGAALMEVLDGPRLLEIIDDGQAEDALAIQLDLTDRLLAADIDVAGLKSLETILTPSLSMPAGSIPDWAMDVVPHAQSLCRALVRDQRAWVTLHGDLHPRNIMMNNGSWCALDARGLFGPKAFEYANAFINPWDRQTLIFQDGRMEAIAQNIASRLSISIGAVAACAIANALYYAQLNFQSGHGRHPTRCIRKLLELVESD